MEQIQNCKLVLSKASYYPSSVEIFDFYKQLQSIQYPLIKQVPQDQLDIFISCPQDEQFNIFVVTPDDQLIDQAATYDAVQIKITHTEAGGLLSFKNIKQCLFYSFISSEWCL